MSRNALIGAVAVLMIGAFLFAGVRILRHIHRLHRQAADALLARPTTPTSAVLAADPLSRLSSVTAPAFLVWGDADKVVPPAQNELPASRALGDHAVKEIILGADHGDPRLYDTTAIVAFLRSHVPLGTPVIFLHGFSYTQDQFRVVPGLHRLWLGVQAAGYPCGSGDFAGDAWGNSNALSALDRQAGASPKIALISVSMGGSLMWRWTEKHPNRVSALVGIAPVCSLKAMCATPLGGFVVRAYR